MTDRQLEEKLARAVDHAAPDQLDHILSRCQPRKGNVSIMKPKKKRSFATYAVAACLALLLIGGSGAGIWYQQANAVASVVSLDVNPSIQLSVNKSEKVLSAVPLNQEAEEILTDLPLEGTDLNVAVNAIVGSLLRHGYLESISSAILISVEDSDADRAARLQQSLSTEVGSALQNAQSGAAVLSQTVAQSAGVETLAQENRISVGKASLIQTIQSYNSRLTFDQLAALSVEELSQLAETGAPGMPIGREEAARIAREYAGLSDADLLKVEVDPELDEYTPHYEVELETRAGEFEYDVDAYTGAVLTGPADVLSGNTSGGTGGTGGTPSGSSGTTGGSGSAGDIGLEAAKAAALSRAGLSSADFVKAERDYDDGRLEYELEFWSGDTEYECEIDGATGAVLKFESERHASSGSGGDIGLEAAKSAAFAHAGVSASQVRELEAEQDYDNGRLEYEIEFKAGAMEYEYTVDGATGTILEYEMDYD